MKNILSLLALVLLAAASQRCGAQEKTAPGKAEADKPAKEAVIDFATQIQPLIESTCFRCHNEKQTDGDLRLDTRELALKGGSTGPAIVPGDPAKSPFYTLADQAVGAEGIMPAEGNPLEKSQLELVKTWIAQGAPWPADAKLKPQPRLIFKQHIQPILEQNCLACHQTSNAEGDLDLTSRKLAFSTGASAPAIVPFHPEKSSLHARTILAKDDEQLMPPSDKGGPLDKELTEHLRMWIAQGALWSDGAMLQPREKPQTGPPSPDTMQLVAQIRELVVADAAKAPADAKMADYTNKVPRTGATYHMVAIKGGEFLMGSPASEKKREQIEGPQQKVKINPFWMGKYEVTWDEYEPFMITKVDRAKNGARIDFDPKKHGIIDAVSQPTKPYTEMSFGMGQKGYPAISMTEHAANKYCQWLSAQTGHFYRLPTEAEWEYACRAGTTTAYSFGDDPAQLTQYAWFYDNSNEKYQKVGLKKPNPWGLHDMHGNVMEWTADQFVPERYVNMQGVADNPFLKPDKIYPRTVRGGTWDDDPEKLRSAARRGSDPSWKAQDPQLPKSIWYHTDAKGLGFRIIRPAKVPSTEEMYFYWNSATGKL